MSNAEQDSLDVDAQIAELFKRVEDLDGKSLKRPASRVVTEVSRLAKANQRLLPYLRALFWHMNLDQGLFEPEHGREVAVELIALLESDDHARRLQPDFPENEYAQTVGWMSACAYDNLAKHTASMAGYNSDGMQACINEGIEVCRRTGKLRCINCFREYATDVYRAADDLDMALHHARTVAATHPDAPGSERRWVGANDEGRLLLLRGQLADAETAARRSLAVAPTYHSPLDARLEAQIGLDEVLLMAGKAEDLSTRASRDLPPGEHPRIDLFWDQRDALQAFFAGDADRALQLLTAWDRQLLERHCLDEWFEVRLRLLALYSLTGRQNKLDALVRPLVERARPARDWLTLHRLARIMEPSEPITPLALAAPLNAGPFAREMASVPESPPRSGPDEEPAATEAPATPLEPTIGTLVQRLRQLSQDEAGRPVLLQEVLAIPLETVTHPFDAVRLLHLARFTVEEVTGRDVLTWAERLLARFAQQAQVLNVFATLGDQLRSQPDLAADVSVERLTQLFRQSLDLDPNDPHNFARAGAFFLSVDNNNEAERCLARGFRLDRGNAFLAQRLAEVYQGAERPRDALAVLDLCLRAGGSVPGLAWDAALTAHRLDQHEAALTYLDRFEELAPGEGWANYYRALALLDLDRAPEALAALDEEERREPDHGFALATLRACAASAVGDAAGCRTQLAKVLATPLSTVDYLTVAGLTQLMARLWRASGILPAADPLRPALTERLLVTGLAPDDLFGPARQSGADVEGINFYRCLVRQPLDEAWPTFPGCLAGQDGWKTYFLLWGVVALDEEEAARQVLAWQGRCYPMPATVEQIELLGDGYHDKPGIVWQGTRWSPAPE